MAVPFVDLKAQYLEIQQDIDRALAAVVDAHVFINGPFVQNFEAEAAAYLGVKHAVGVANGSDALFLAMLALGIKPGDEVITVPHTYVATPEAIYRVGAKVVFVDVDPVSWNMDPSKLKAAITPRTKAIMPVHIFGQCANMDAIREIAGGKIKIVEDAAQCWGAEYRGVKAGGLGDLACFSFYPTKTLGAFGDAGLVTSNDDHLADMIRALRVHGESKRYYNSFHGMNSRLDAMQAAILSEKLKHVDRWNFERARIAAYYRSRFEGTAVKLGEIAEGNTHVWHQCVARVPNRDRLREALAAKEIGTAVYYPVPQHLQACFADLGGKVGDYPVAEALSNEGVALPCWPGMSEDMMAEVADAVVAFYE